MEKSVAQTQTYQDMAVRLSHLSSPARRALIRKAAKSPAVTLERQRSTVQVIEPVDRKVLLMLFTKPAVMAEQ